MASSARMVTESTETCSSLLASRGGTSGVTAAGAMKGLGMPMDASMLVEGGKAAGILAILVALGRGIAYLLNWQGARDERRAAKMREWEESLQRREREYRERIESDLEALHRDVASLRGTVARVCNAGAGLALELRKHDPDSAALERWQRVLQGAFPTDPVLPSDMSSLVLQLKKQIPAKRRSRRDED